MDAIIFFPRRADRAGKREDSGPWSAIRFGFELILSRGFTGEPAIAISQRFVDEAIQKFSSVLFVGAAADVLQSPGKGQCGPVGFGSPPTVFVAPYRLFEPGHSRKLRNIADVRRQTKSRFLACGRKARRVVPPRNDANFFANELAHLG